MDEFVVTQRSGHARDERIEDEVKSAVDPVTQSMSISDHSTPESTPDFGPSALGAATH
ncbi:MAG: hypothetical protein CM15mP68_5480 [Pseudomonadota bacterium]|nr:MAG: hypothetical protein CM15mP68_5480 [Pseudomonadota bacterium]